MSEDEYRNSNNKYIFLNNYYLIGTLDTNNGTLLDTQKNLSELNNKVRATVANNSYTNTK